MISNASALTTAYSGWPVILDSNLLLLRWCGALDISLLKTFKRLQAFELNDIQTLGEILSLLGAVKTTPHVLTEVSNLANALPSWKKLAWANHLAEQICLVEEYWEPASVVLHDRSLGVFGLTDAALGRLARNHVILSVDWPLCNFLAAQGLAAINFHSLRQAAFSR
jgi:hypothetical protein